MLASNNLIIYIYMFSNICGDPRVIKSCFLPAPNTAPMQHHRYNQYWLARAAFYHAGLAQQAFRASEDSWPGLGPLKDGLAKALFPTPSCLLDDAECPQIIKQEPILAGALL